jgi:hypothetical protein
MHIPKIMDTTAFLAEEVGVVFFVAGAEVVSLFDGPVVVILLVSSSVVFVISSKTAVLVVFNSVVAAVTLAVLFESVIKVIEVAELVVGIVLVVAVVPIVFVLEFVVVETSPNGPSESNDMIVELKMIGCFVVTTVVVVLVDNIVPGNGGIATNELFVLVSIMLLVVI